MTEPNARAELVALLRRAARVEHLFTLQYLYPAYCLKERYASLSGAQRPLPHTLLHVAIDEMRHLRTINRILATLGEKPELGRPAFPELDYYPFPLELEALSPISLAKYVYAEAPHGALAEGKPLRERLRTILSGQPPGEGNIGSLYIELRARVAGSDLPEITKARFEQLLRSIQHDGETYHFEFFASLLDGSHPALRDPEVWDDPRSPRFPSRDVARNPRAEGGVGAAPIESGGRHRPSLSGEAQLLGQISNRIYWAVMIMLGVGYEAGAADRLERRATDLMALALAPLSGALSEHGAGLPFEPLPEPVDVSILRALEILDDALARVARLAHHPVSFALRDIVIEVRDEVFALWDQRMKRCQLPEDACVVVGAGPAGLAAAHSLARAGLKVALLEQDTSLGGKAWTHRANPADRARDHGIHGWWPSYANFNRLLESVGADPDRLFRDANGGAVVGPNDEIASASKIPFRLPSPMHLPIYQLALGFVGVFDLVHALRATLEILAFDHERDYPDYDAESFEEFMIRLGLPYRLQRYILGPFAIGFDYARPDEVSASSVLSAFQFYFLPNQNRVIPRWPIGVPDELIFRPIADDIERNHGTILRSLEVHSLSIEEGRLQGFWARDTATAHASQRICALELPLSEIPFDEMLRRNTQSGAILVRRDGDGVLAFSARCPHRDDTVHWDPTTCRLRCRGHDSVFDLDGRLVRGPATADLRPLEIDREGDRIRVYVDNDVRFHRCRHLILATDVRRAKSILDASAGVPTELRARMEPLRANSLVVARFWFTAGTETPRFETIVIPEAYFGEIYFNVSRVHPDTAHEGVVIELHSMDYRGEWSQRSDEAIRDAALGDLALISPALNLESLQGYRVQRHADIFTSYEPGRDDSRPSAASGVAGLSLAGDWTKADWSVWMMERAVVSGLRAANRVREAFGKSPLEILRPPADDLTMQWTRSIARVLRQIARTLGSTGVTPVGETTSSGASHARDGASNDRPGGALGHAAPR